MFWQRLDQSENSDHVFLPGTQSQHPSPADKPEMVGSTLTWAVATFHSQCCAKSVWSSYRLPVSARYQQANDTRLWVPPTPKGADAVDARCSARLCLCLPMPESPGTLLLTTSWACSQDSGWGSFLSWGIESLIRCDLKGNSHWLQVSISRQKTKMIFDFS